MGILNALKKALGTDSAKATALEADFDPKTTLAQIEARHAQTFEREAGARLSELGALVRELGNSAKRISDSELDAEKLGDNERARRVAQTSKHALSRRLAALAPKLAPPTRPDGPEELLTYARRARDVLRQETEASKKNIMYTGAVGGVPLGDTAKTLEGIQHALDALLELSEKSPLRTVRDLQKEAEELDAQKQQAKALQKESEAKQRKEKETQAHAHDAQKAAQAVLESPAHARMTRLEEEKKEIEQERDRIARQARDALSGAEKTLLRLQKLAEGGTYALLPEEKRALDAYLSDPAAALKNDPRAERLKTVLDHAKEAVQSGTIAFKDARDREKREAALASARAFDYFGEVFWKNNETEKKLRETERTIREDPTLANLERLSRTAREKQRLFEQAKADAERAKEAAQREGKRATDAEKALREKVESLWSAQA